MLPDLPDKGKQVEIHQACFVRDVFAGEELKAVFLVKGYRLIVVISIYRDKPASSFVTPGEKHLYEIENVGPYSFVLVFFIYCKTPDLHRRVCRSSFLVGDLAGNLVRYRLSLSVFVDDFIVEDAKERYCLVLVNERIGDG